MNKTNTATLLFCLLGTLLPTLGTAQTCNTTQLVAATPSRQFADNNDGTITDKKTKLTWKKCSEAQLWNSNTGECDGIANAYTWQEALAQVPLANSDRFAEKTDWRLPSFQELASLVETQCSEPSINLSIFPGTSPEVFWSASSYGSKSDFAHYVNFNIGQISASNKTETYLVRLVRGAVW
jgi:Protein of unknown function (DUF1566)